MMKRRNFNLIKTGRKNKLALAVGLALAMSAMGSVYASGNDDTFKNFANGEKLLQTAANWRTYREFLNSTGLQAIGADKAYALGYSGDGVTLGIVDTGVRTDHEEFEGKVDLVNEIVNDWTDKETWHGSHVAGIMVAKKSIGGFGEKNRNMMGVAFNANLKSIDYGLKKNKRIGLTKKYISTLSKDVKIINNSWNPETGGDSFIDFAKNDIKNNDRVYVFSAGNDGNIDVSRKMTGKFANDVNIKSNFINVVNIDDMNNVSITSNIAKGAHENTVCAVGTNVNSVSANSLSDYTDMSGTSMAAPYVSGTLGLVQGANPYLSGKQLVDVVLTTANKNFEHPKFAITLKNHEEDDVKIIDGINLICIDYNDKINDISNDLKEYFSKSSDEYLENLLETNLVDVSKFNSLKNISNLISSINDWENSYYNIVTIENDHIICENKKAKEIIMKIKELYEIKDVYGIQMQANKLRDLLVDLIADDATTKLLSGIENQSNFYKKYNYSFEEVHGQGVVDAGKAVQGLGAIDVDRLSQEDITTKYSNEKFYMYKVDTKNARDNYNKRNYSIWSNDISEKNVTDIHAGLEKTGSVGLILLGENTYNGPTVSKGGFLHIVRGVNGDVYTIGNRGASTEINGYAKRVYAIKDGNVKISDIVSKNYANVDADFLAAALPDTNKVDINGGLFAIGKNSITGEGSTINVNLTRSDSAINGALYQDELGKINLSLANEAKFILQQGTGYYAGNSYKSNDTINNLTLNNSGEFDLSKDGCFTKLTINNLNGYNGMFSLNTDLKNNIGDMIIVRNAEGDVLQNLKIYDKNLFDISNVDNPLLVVQAPSNVIFSGILMDEGISKWTPIITKSNDENGQSKWFFSGYTNDVNYDNPYMTAMVKSYYTTDDTINKGIEATTNRYNTIHVVDVEQSKGEAFQIKSLNAYKSAISGNVQFINSGKVKLTAEHNSKGLFLDEFAGISTEKGNFSAQQDFSIDMLDSYSRKTVAIHNIKQADLNGNLDISLSASRIGVGILNSGNLKTHNDVSIISGSDAIMGVDNSGEMIIYGDLTLKDNYNEDNKYRYYSGILNRNEQGTAKIYVSGDVNIELSNNDAERYYYGYNDIYNYRNTPEKFVQGIFNNGGTIIVDGAIRMTNSDKRLDGIVNYSGNMIIGSIDSALEVENRGFMEIKNRVKDVYLVNRGKLVLPDIAYLSYLSNSGELHGNELDISGDFYQGDGNVDYNNIYVDGIMTLSGGESTIGNLIVNNVNEEKAAIKIPYSGNAKTVIKNLDIKNNGIDFISANQDASLNITDDCYIKNNNIQKNAIDKNYGNGHCYGELNINSSGKGIVKIVGEICDNGSWDDENFKTTKINLSNSDSFITTHIGGGDGIDLKMSNGAILELSDNVDGKNEYNRKYYRIGNIDLSSKAIIALSTLNSKSGLEIYRTKLGKEFNVVQLSGTDGIIRIGIMQDENMKGSITSDIFSIRKNITEGAKHIVELLPMQADFMLTNDTKINPFIIIKDSSENNGGYKLNFTINPFDAGAYNYTPTLTNEKSQDNVDLWKVTDIKLTGSTPNPTPDPDPNPNPTPDPEPDPNPNPTPNPDPTPAPVLSNLTYNTRANAINNYYRWRDEYNNLQKRLGDLRMSKEENGLWARTFHGKEESGKYGLNNQYNAFQIGYDKQLLQDDGGKWFIGAAVTSYDGKTNYAKQGKADNNSIGLALYGSYLGEKGHYFDVVARHSRLKSELTSYAAGTGNKITGDYHNWGSSLSMEYGRRISMKHDFYLQPEAELTYGTTSSASYSLSDGSRVKQDGISSLTARAGLTVGKEFKNSNIFASISAVHDFGDDNVFSITDKYGKTYKDISNLKDSWYELSVGGNVKFNNNTYVYADLEKTFGGDIQTKWRYNFGVRYSF